MRRTNGLYIPYSPPPLCRLGDVTRRSPRDRFGELLGSRVLRFRDNKRPNHRIIGCSQLRPLQMLPLEGCISALASNWRLGRLVAGGRLVYLATADFSTCP